jgi:hypothetical protein
MVSKNMTDGSQQTPGVAAGAAERGPGSCSTASGPPDLPVAFGPAAAAAAADAAQASDADILLHLPQDIFVDHVIVPYLSVRDKQALRQTSRCVRVCGGVWGVRGLWVGMEGLCHALLSSYPIADVLGVPPAAAYTSGLVRPAHTLHVTYTLAVDG